MPLLSKSFIVWFNNPKLSDVTFVIPNGDSDPTILHSHSFLLSARSSIFEEMLEELLEDKLEGIITIPINQENATNFENLLKYLYTDECDLTHENCFDLLRLSNIYKIETLSSKCSEFMKNNLSIDWACKYLKESNAMELNNLKDLILKFIAKNFIEVLKHDSFLLLNEETLCDILKLEQLNDVNEIDVFNAVIKWSEYECQSRDLPVTIQNQRLVLDKSIYLIRFPNMSTEEFACCIDKYDGLLESNEVTSILKSIVNKSIKTEFASGERNKIKSPILPPSVPTIQTSSNEIYNDFNARLNVLKNPKMIPVKKNVIFSTSKKILLTRLNLECHDYQFKIRIFEQIGNTINYRLLYDCGKEYQALESGGNSINYIDEKSQIILEPLLKYKIIFRSEPNLMITDFYGDNLKKIHNVTDIQFKFHETNSLFRAIGFKKI